MKWLSNLGVSLSKDCDIVNWELNHNKMTYREARLVKLITGNDWSLQNGCTVQESEVGEAFRVL